MHNPALTSVTTSNLKSRKLPFNIIEIFSKVMLFFCLGGYAQNHGLQVKPRDLVTMYFSKGAKRLQEKLSMM